MPLIILEFQAWYWSNVVQLLRNDKTLVPTTFWARQRTVFNKARAADRDGDSFIIHYFAVTVAHVIYSSVIEHVYRYQRRFPEQYI